MFKPRGSIRNTQNASLSLMVSAVPNALTASVSRSSIVSRPRSKTMIGLRHILRSTSE
jgi:hypothetical protein